MGSKGAQRQSQGWGSGGLETGSCSGAWTPWTTRASPNVMEKGLSSHVDLVRGLWPREKQGTRGTWSVSTESRSQGRWAGVHRGPDLGETEAVVAREGRGACCRLTVKPRGQCLFRKGEGRGRTGRRGAREEGERCLDQWKDHDSRWFQERMRPARGWEESDW